MSGIGDRVSGLLRRGHRSRRGSSSSAPTQEGQPSQDEGEILTGHAINEADAPFIDLESDQEKQAYELLKECVFLHSPMFDPILLKQIGMGVEFITVFEHVGWSRVAPVHELGSRLLTIQFVGTPLIVDYGISFHCFGVEYSLYWKDVAAHLGFNACCSIKLDFSLSGHNHHSFWHLISGHNVGENSNPMPTTSIIPHLGFCISGLLVPFSPEMIPIWFWILS